MLPQDRIIKKINKCLALSQSNNPHEAHRAMAQAKKMMAMHGISQDDRRIALPQRAWMPEETPVMDEADVTVKKKRRVINPLYYLMVVMRQVFG